MSQVIATDLGSLVSEIHEWPRQWRGHWIGSADRPDVQGSIGLSALAPRAAFSRVHYRRDFSLDRVPEIAMARLTADSRYVLLVNGTEVGRGPIRSQPRRLRYDDFDLSPFLREGDNTVAVLVTYYGAANAFWQPATAIGALGTDAVLVFEADLGGEFLISDARWKAQRSTAWATFDAESIDGVPVEFLDARELDLNWSEPGDHAASWPAAAIISASHIGSLARSQPPTDPYGALLERGIGALGGARVEPATVIVERRSRPEEWAKDQPARRVEQVLRGEGAPAAVSSRVPARSAVAIGEVLSVEVDFGRVVAGFVELDIEVPRGTEVELHYREKRFDPSVPQSFSDPSSGARYIARGADDRYRGIEINGLRFIHLVFHAEQPIDVAITALRVREYRYPWSGDAYFESDDDEINALYLAGRRTVELNSFDAFTDCPTREQRAWVGDGVVHQLVHLTTNADWRLARNYVTLGDSPRSDHMLPMSVAGDVESAETLTIPDWSLHWIRGVHNLFRYDGDREALLEVLPTVEKVLRWYLPYVDEHGTIADVPEWNLVDWSSVFSGGRSSILTALWARALGDFAEMAEYVGNAGSARWARDRITAATAGFEDFWDEARGTYVDQIVDGIRRPAASQAAGAAAIVSGLVPVHRWGRIVETITDRSTLVVRSWIGSTDGGYDGQKMADQMRGIQRIDWDVEREIVRAEPFFSYLVHDAIALAGHADDLVDIIRDWSVSLVDGYDTFAECWGWGTPVHGWSSTPTKDIVTSILGITPGAPGFVRARIAPHLGSLTRVEGSAPTPHGSISVSIVDSVAAISSPVPVVFVDSSGDEHELSPGSHRLPF